MPKGGHRATLQHAGKRGSPSAPRSHSSSSATFEESFKYGTPQAKIAQLTPSVCSLPSNDLTSQRNSLDQGALLNVPWLSESRSHRVGSCQTASKYPSGPLVMNHTGHSMVHHMATGIFPLIHAAVVAIFGHPKGDPGRKVEHDGSLPTGPSNSLIKSIVASLISAYFKD